MNAENKQTEKQKATEKFNKIRDYILKNASTHHESTNSEYFVTVRKNVHLKYYPSLDEEGEVLAYYESNSNKCQEEIFLEEDIEDYHDELNEMLEVIKK